jgi:beta-galactosidase
MIYIKLFETHNEYESYVESGLTRPNLSVCKDIPKEVHYNPRRCEETTSYEIIGEPSYPSTVLATATSFVISFEYKRTDINYRCIKSVTQGSDSVEVIITENPSTEERVVSGNCNYHGLSIPYSVTQEGLSYSESYLTFDVLTSGTINWVSQSGVTKTISYSKDYGETWVEITSSADGSAINVNAGDKLLIKGNNDQYSIAKDAGSRFSGDTARYDVYGNIMSLIGGDNFKSLKSFNGKTWVFHNLFNGSGIKSAENLILPVTELTECCYRAMFAGLSNNTGDKILTKAPKIIPATTMAVSACCYMFQNTLITVAPELPCNVLADYCYYRMFFTSSINYLKCLATDISATQCTYEWCRTVPKTGTFIKHPSMNDWAINDKSGIPPTDWTVIDDVYEKSNRSLNTWTYDNNEIEVPYSINAVDGHSASYAKGTFDFETSVNLDESQPTYLWFQHADQTADIYVDDTKVETHWGGYNAFFTDISNHVHSGTNEIRVSLCNTTRNTLAPASGDFNFNATLGKVKLLTSPVLPSMNYGYDGFHITSTVSSASATINVKTSIPTGATVVCSISGTNCNYSETSASTGSEMIFTTTIANPHLWNGTIDPYLYIVKLDVYYNDELYHSYTRPYGLRFYEYVINDTVKYGTVSNPYTGFLLNGQPYLLRGVCMHDDVEGRANALLDSDYVQEFNIIQELGCNFLRLAHYPHPKEVYDKCDELGIVVQTEVPCVDKLQMSLPSDYYEHLNVQYADMVNQHYNHPCIMFWGLGNEAKITDSDEGREFAKTKLEGYTALIKNLDSERLVGIVAHALIDPSSYFGNPDIDWFGCNHYVGWYQSRTSRNPSSVINRCLSSTTTELGKAFALSEYGAGGTQNCHSETPSDTTDKASAGARHDIEYQMWIHEGHIAAIRNYPQLIFTSLWQLFDIAVSSRDEGYTICIDGENTYIDDNLRYINDKGIVERDHTTKKDTFYLYKAEWNTVDTFVHICGKSFSKTTNRVIKCYTNESGTFTLKVNNNVVATATSSNHIVTFAAQNFNNGDVIVVEGNTTSDTFTFICSPTSTYEIVGTPSYPSTIEGDDVSFDITVNYRRSDTDSACTETVTTGTDIITVECGENPSTTDSRAISGTVDYHGNTIEYDVTQDVGGFKFRGVYDDSSINKVACDNNPTLTSGETKPNGYTASAMTSAEIGNCVTTIGADTFRDCSGLTSVTIPTSVTSIGDNAIRSCTSLKSVTIPGSVTSIGSAAFRFSTGLTSISIPDSVTSIGNEAFSYCYSLKNTTIGSGITTISESAFYNCRKLASITIPSNVTSISDNAFRDCSVLTSVTIPTSVTSIGDRAFYNCKALTSITIPDSVTSIGGSAFNTCSALTSVTVNAVTPPTLGTSVFNTTNDCPIYVPSGSVSAYKSATNWSNYASRIQAIP